MLWFGNHILANKVNYLQTVIDLHDRTEVLYEPIFDLATLIAESKVIHAKFISVLEKVPDSNYELVVSGAMSLRDHMNNAIRHEAWHSGQIAVINRLFAEKFR